MTEQSVGISGLRLEFKKGDDLDGTVHFGRYAAKIAGK